jgi:dihydrodiol dehydrogenase / D-xylose 1-dehydrogenase (NADP)
MKRFRFGIAGAGSIAHKFAEGLTVIKDAELAGAASRTPGKALEFVVEFKGIYPDAKAYDSYEEMARDPSIDAVYISNLHPQHAEAAILFLNHRKPVLCEKPFALNSTETGKMLEAAAVHDTFLMEAMWTRFFPVNIQVKEWIGSGRIGDVRTVTSDFGMRLMGSADLRTVVPEKGGGALLDLGIYSVSYLSMIFGHAPVRITTAAEMTLSGVDASFGAILKYGEIDGNLAKSAQTACITAAIDRNLSQTMNIVGTGGVIRVSRFWMADRADLFEFSDSGELSDTPTITYEPERIGNGYQYEAQEVMKRVLAGEKESAIMPLSETLSIMETLDALRREWGLVYPQEKDA